MAKQDVMKSIVRHQVVAICRGLTAEEALLSVRAATAGGIRLFEITFDQRAEDPLSETVRAIRLVKEQGPAGITVGAGTVMTAAQLEAAREAGAEFILAPNVNTEVIQKAAECGILSVPGALSPTEAAAAYGAGADIVKIFPAGLLGPGYIRAIRGPLNHIPLMAVGNIDGKNFRDYLAAGCMSVGIGSCLIDGKLVREKRFEELTALAKAYVGQEMRE